MLKSTFKSPEKKNTYLFGSLLTILLCIMGKLARWGSICVAVGFSDMWHVTGDRWQVTCDKCHLTDWLGGFFWYRWNYPHTARDLCLQYAGFFFTFQLKCFFVLFFVVVGLSSMLMFNQYFLELTALSGFVYI